MMNESPLLTVPHDYELREPDDDTIRSDCGTCPRECAKHLGSECNFALEYCRYNPHAYMP